MAIDDDDDELTWRRAGAGRVLQPPTALDHAKAYGPPLIIAALWIAGLYLCGGLLGVPYVCVSLLLFLCMRTVAKRKGALSAYSIFNPNFERGLGQLTSADWDAQYRGGLVPTPESERVSKFGALPGAQGLMEGQGRVLGGGSGGGGAATGGGGAGGGNSLLAQLAAERRAREQLAAGGKTD